MERSNKNLKTPNNSLNIDYNGDDGSKNHFGEVLMSESNLK